MSTLMLQLQYFTILKESFEMKDKKSWFKKGIKDGIPIALGYFAISFSLGIAAKNTGLTAIQAMLMSLTSLTATGEFVALGLISSGATYLEMAMTQLVINLRYCLMSCSLSQKVDPKARYFHRFLLSAGVTDEIFGISSSVEGKLSPLYSYGAMCVAVPAWTFGTFLGVTAGNIMPARVLSALSIALFGMFIAIIVPPAKGDKVMAGVIMISMLASTLFYYLPVVSKISSGFRIIILTVVIAGIAAVLFPTEREEAEHEI